MLIVDGFVGSSNESLSPHLVFLGFPTEDNPRVDLQSNAKPNESGET